MVLRLLEMNWEIVMDVLTVTEREISMALLLMEMNWEIVMALQMLGTYWESGMALLLLVLYLVALEMQRELQLGWL